MTSPDLPQLSLRQKREAVIAQLCESFTLDRLQAEELEALLDRAHRASSVEDLESIVGVLPEPVRQTSPEEARDREPERTVLAVMGGAERRGDWFAGGDLHVVAIMGGVVLDFREAQLPAGVTDVEIVAVMGGVEIIVSPETRVASSGIGILGGFGSAGEPTRKPVHGEAPTLRVSGVAIMGGVEIRRSERGARGRKGKRLKSGGEGAE
jgi:hypothetical protein